MKLRAYQERGISDIRARFLGGDRRVCYVAPCGAGKTLLMAYMASQAGRRGKRALFLVHRRELIDQAAETLKALHIHHGIVGVSDSDRNKIMIGSVQTVARRIDRLPEPDLIILDECHHAAAGTWLKAIAAYPSSYVVGLTATPARLGGQGLGSVFESLVLGPTAKELIGLGYLSPYQYYAPPMVADLGDVRTVRGDYDQAELAGRMDRPSITGDAIAHYEKLAAGTQAIVYCASIRHSQNTALAFRSRGLCAYHVDGATPRDERRAIMQGFRARKIQILCNCDLFGEGVDVPGMETVILLRPTQSLTLYIQQAMRGMRADKANPEKRAIILDHVGNVYRHGLPDDEREWSLDSRQKKQRSKQENTVKIKVCENCFSVHKPAPECPYCGFSYPLQERIVEEKSGELKELTKIEKAKKRMEVGMARTVEELKQIAIQRGYKPGWVYLQAKLKGLR